MLIYGIGGCVKIRLEFDITPYPKRTPIFSTRGKFARAIPNKKTKAFQEEIKRTCKYTGPIIETPLQVKAIFFFVRPKSVKRNYPSVKPDLDNLSKSLMDALEGVIFKNDAQIIDMKLTKRYAEKAKIIVEIEEINENQG